jgi:hypothetical protein
MNAFPPPRRGRPSLAERSAASGHGVAGQAARQATGQAASGPTAEVPARQAPEQAEVGAAPSPTPKHCWVDDPRWPGRRPGLLLAWSRAERGWWGLVVLVEDGDQVVTEWIAGAALTSA